MARLPYPGPSYVSGVMHHLPERLQRTNIGRQSRFWTFFTFWYIRPLRMNRTGNNDKPLLLGVQSVLIVYQM